MKRLGAYIATFLIAAAAALSLAAPANAVLDENGYVVAIIIGPNGEVYY